MTVRTRIAPSPTGDPHVGTGYIALFDYCLAKAYGGQFVLRIEDTDQQRSTRASEEMILSSLKWLGLEWDEGPDVGGPYGPYRQSERSAIYYEHAMQLIAHGHAFYSFATAQDLAKMRARQTAENSARKGYDLNEWELSAQEVESKLNAGLPYTVRMRVPKEGVVTFEDRLRGTLEFDVAQIDAQILIKSDGLPTYHLANVVDDHLMKITHVLRGEEWLSSTPKHVLLYEYFGWEMPEFVHLPLLRNEDTSKLSKRKNPTSISYYERMGIMPEALLNFLGTMGWSMPDGREHFKLEEMVEVFSQGGIDRISLGGPVFDLTKLRAFNGDWIRELSLDDFLARMQKWAFGRPGTARQMLNMVQQRVKSFSDVAPLVAHFFSGLPGVSMEDLVTSKLDAYATLEAMQFVLWRLDALRVWDLDHVRTVFEEMAKAMGHKQRDFNKPFFVAMSGSLVSTPLYESYVVLGSDMARARLRHAIVVLNGGALLGKKKLKKLEKSYAHVLAAVAQQEGT